VTSPGPYPPPGWQPPPPPGWQPPPPVWQPQGWYPPPQAWYPQQPAWQPQPQPWYPPPQAWYPPPKPPTPLPHDVPQPFLHVMRSRTWGWWRPLLGILFLAAVYAVASILSTLVVFVALLPTGTTWIGGLSEEDLGDPRVLLVTNASLMIAIPVVWLVWITVHQMRIGWSASVLGRLRFRLFLPWTLAAVATLGLVIVASFGVDAAFGARFSGPTADFGWLVVVVVLTTPVQSAAEEYVFRGYLSQAVAGWFRAERAGAVVAALVTATLFSLAHVPPDWPTFWARFLVGVACSAVVRLTGGLEASISLHAVNNVLVFLLGGLAGESGVSSSTDEWLSALLTGVGLLAYVWVVRLLLPRVRPETRTAAQDLRPLPPAPAWAGAPGGAPGVVGGLPATSGMVSSWRREVPHGPWGMG
jgi:membrane protease YdiL (CAAX protease family)